MKLQLNDKEFRLLKKRLREVSVSKLQVGILTGRKHKGSNAGIAEIAAFHEFGTKNIPQRSFIRATFDSSDFKNKFKQNAVTVFRKIIDGSNGRDEIARLGSWGASKIKDYVLQNDIRPKLKPSTEKAKGSTKPLVDTKQMVNAINYKIRK